MATSTLEIPVTHIIEANNYSTTLSKLSLKYYGTPNLWQKIAEENGIEGDTILKPGNEVRIPGNPQFWKYQTSLIIKNRNVFHAYAPFQGSDEDTNSPLVLIPPLLVPGTLFTKEISLSIDHLCLIQEDLDPASFDNDDFALKWKPGPTKTKKSSDLVAQIKVKANNVWRTARDARNKFKENFLELRQHIEDLELKGAILLGGLDIVTQRIAEAVPGNFEETLFFRYGFNRGFGSEGNPYCDLQPGMRVRIGYGTNQPANADDAPRTLAFTQDGRIGFDAFLASTSPPAAPFTPAQSSANSLMDVSAVGNARRHYRLVYPVHNMDKVILIGADTLEDLQKATEGFSTNGSTNGTAVPHTGERPVVVFELPAKLVGIPEFSIDIKIVTGTEVTQQPFQYFSLGTTTADVINVLAPGTKPIDLLTVGRRPVKVRRLFTPPSGLPEYRDVMFDLSPFNVVTGADISRLPLVSRDRVEITLTSPKQQ